MDLAAKADFIGRLQSGEIGSLFDPIKKKKLKTVETCHKKVTLTSSLGKVINHVFQYPRSILFFICFIFSASHYFYILV